MDDQDKQNDLKKSHNENIPQLSKADILINLFSSFSEKENSKEFDIMKSDLINYISLQENDTNVNPIISDEIKFKNLLYNSLEKNLIEIMYINKKEYRKEKIMRLYFWYQNRMKTFKDLRFINKKTYNDIDAVIDDVYFKEKLDLIKHDQEHQIEDDILKEQMSHRSAIFDKSLIDEYKRNHVYENIFYKKLFKKKTKMPKLKKNLKPDLEKPDRPVGTHTIYYSYKDGTRPVSIAKINLNDKKILETPAGGERERTFHTKLGEKKYVNVGIEKEIKSSFSYYRPEMDFNVLNAEKKIIEKKNKLLAEKKNQEEIKKNLKDFGRMRSLYKANEEKKCQLKQIINYYANTKKIESKLLSKYKKPFIPGKNISLPKNNHQKEENSINNINNIYGNLNMRSSVSILDNLIPFKIDKKDTEKENKLDKKFYSQNISEFSEENEEKIKKEKEEEKKINRKMQKKLTYNRGEIAKKFRRIGINGDKIILNDAKNMDKKTKEIIDKEKEKISNYDMKIKFKKLDIKQKLLNDKLEQAKNENNEEEDNYNNETKKKNSKIPSDLVFKLINDEPVFKQNLIYKKLCDLNSKSGEKKDNYYEDEADNIYNNFCLSAYNIKNTNILDKYNKNLDSSVKLMRHISSYTKFHDKKKLMNKSDSFDSYRYNYLDLRKTIGEFKKYEYQEIMNRISKRNKEKEDEKSNTKIKDNFEKRINNIRYQKQKDLSSAIMNPEIDNTYPSCFLPKTGWSLISKNEPVVAKKKKRRFRR